MTPSYFFKYYSRCCFEGYFVDVTKIYKQLGFPGGSVVKNPPVSAGNMSSVPDPGRSHML